MMLSIALLLAATGAQASDSECVGRRMDCYLDAYNVCSFETEKDGLCHKKILASCDRTYKCGGVGISGLPEAPLNPGYKLHSKVTYAESCAPYRNLIEGRINAAVARLQDCVNYAFVKEDLAKRLYTTYESSQLIRIRCDEPPRANWCAAAGGGEIWLSPSRMLEPGSFCNPELGPYFVHEMAHVAGFLHGPEHNELGETGAPDQVYSLQNYCMRPARMWIMRSRRTEDVVQPARLSCMRDYQEFTPSTDRDRFWDEYRARMDRGEDPCPASLDPALAEKPKPGRRGD